MTNLIQPADSQRILGSTKLHSLRPERVRLGTDTASASAAEISLPGRIAETVYAGAHTRYLIDTDEGMRFIAEKQNTHTPSTTTGISRGDRVSVMFDRDHATVVPEAAAPLLNTH